MAIAIEIRERQKHHLNSLLKIKRVNSDAKVGAIIQEEIKDAVAVMEQADVAWVEKIAAVKAI